MDELKSKPCQRCGSDHNRLERYVDTDEHLVLYRVCCDACSYAPDHWEEAPEEARRYWNTRQIEDALVARISELERESDAMQEASITLGEDRYFWKGEAEVRRTYMDKLQYENDRLKSSLKAISIGMLYPKEYAAATLNPPQEVPAPQP